MIIGWTPEGFHGLCHKNAESRAKAFHFLADAWLALADQKAKSGYNGTTAIEIEMPQDYMDLEPVDREFIRLYFNKLGWLANYEAPFLTLEPINFCGG